MNYFDKSVKFENYLYFFMLITNQDEKNHIRHDMLVRSVVLYGAQGVPGGTGPCTEHLAGTSRLCPCFLSDERYEG